MKIELTAEQLAIIDEALQKLPYNIAKPLIDNISLQKIARTGEPAINARFPVFKVKSDPCLMEPIEPIEPMENMPPIVMSDYKFCDKGRLVINHEGKIIGQIKDTPHVLLTTL